LEEAGGRNSIYVTPRDEDELAIRIEQVLENPQFAARIIRMGKKYLKRFSKRESARRLIQIYKDLI
jgi:glycosyltransferase involved in cell wall biosynthesis